AFVVPGLDVDALSGTRGRTTKTCHAARRSILPLGQTMHPAKTLRIGTALFGVADRVDAIVDRLEHGVRARAERHLLGVRESATDGLTEPFDQRGDERLYADAALRPLEGLSLDFAGSQPLGA